MPPSSDKTHGNDADPGVPFFRTWRGVYAFVFTCFILVVVLLTIFSFVYA